jgi:hypothetical protein
MTPSMAVAVTALVFSTTGSAFAAKTLIDGSDIKNNSITSADIKDGTLSTRDIEEGSINLDRLSEGTQNRINLHAQDGTNGANGATGAAGAKGDTGAQGTKGDAGAKGDTGAKGDAGSDAQHAVKSLVPFVDGESTTQSNEWRSYNGTTIDADGIKFGQFADGTDWTSAYTYGLKGVRLKDIALLAYSARYTGGAGAGAAPYVVLVTENGDHVAFSPSTQSGVTPKAGAWQRWVVTQGSVRYNDDPATGLDMTWAELITAHPNDKIDYVSVQAGNTGVSNGSTSHVRNVTMEATGAEAAFASFTFGS